MNSFLLAGPASEPLSLAEAKAFLRVDDDQEDAYIGSLIIAARLHVEAMTSRALIYQSWRLVLDNWPETRLVRLPVSPVSALIAVRTLNDAAEETELDLADFVLRGQGETAVVDVAATVSGSTAPRARAGIEIDFTAGFGPDATAVPQDLKHMILLLLGHWFEFRDSVVMPGSAGPVPAGFEALAASYRTPRI